MTTTCPELPGMRFLERLGSGGFSDVYLYERDQPRIKVAVKVLKADVLDAAQRRQFVDEADVMAELAEHPFIVPVIGAGTADDGRPYLVMRYYPPPDLGERVAAQPMSVPDALRTGIQLASAIETAHQAGIIHRDIKPSNVLVSSYGVPALSDFGIAGRAADHADDDNVGVSMPWSPPEVLTGSSNGTVTSDVYSLAATIWNLVVGRSPFTIRGGDNSERAMFTRIVHSRPPTTGRADVPGSLDRLLQQAMSKDPAHRPQSALELARHLQRVEQELRLARTEIVVLEPVAEGQPTPPLAGSPAESPAAERTRERPRYDAPGEPARPVLQPVRSEATQSTKRRPVVVPPEPEGPGATAVRPPEVVPQPGRSPGAAGATQQRPVAVPSPQPATTARHVDRTARRPTTAPGPADEPAESTAAGPSGRGGRRGIWAVAALLLVAVAGVGVLLSRGGDPRAGNTDLPNDTGAHDPGDAVGGSGRPPAPVIESSAHDGKAVFSWTPDSPSDTYSVQRDGGPLEPVQGHRVVLPVAAGSEVCITVQVVRSGVVNQAHDCQKG